MKSSAPAKLARRIESEAVVDLGLEAEIVETVLPNASARWRGLSMRPTASVDDAIELVAESGRDPVAVLRRALGAPCGGGWETDRSLAEQIAAATMKALLLDIAAEAGAETGRADTKASGRRRVPQP